MRAYEYHAVETSPDWLMYTETDRLFSVANTPDGPVTGAALLVPAFGVSVANLFIPAFSLSSTGVRTLRFDGRYNFGVSNGDIMYHSLAVALEDARIAARKLIETSGSDKFVVVGMSIASVVALKIASEYPNSRAALFVPAVDIARMVNLAAKRPGAVERYRRRDPEMDKVVNVFGHFVRGQVFADDMDSSGFGSVEEVIALAKQVRGRADLFLAEKDEFAVPEHDRMLIDALAAEKRITTLKGVGHDFGRSPVALKAGFNGLIRLAQEHFDIPVDQRATALPPEASFVAAAKADRAVIQAFLDKGAPVSPVPVATELEKVAIGSISEEPAMGLIG
jgi:pimeloyl-ACP methyl ester carboxylesterase